jgi:hypothetical protein
MKRIVKKTKKPKFVKKSSYTAAKRLVKKLIDYGHGDTLLDHREKDGLHQETIYIIAKAMEKFQKL